MSYRDGKVLLAAHVEPALRDHAREAARAAGLEFSQWVTRAVQQAMARESTDRAIATASRQLEGELLAALRSLVAYCVVHDSCWGGGCNVELSRLRFNCPSCPEVPGNGGPPPSIDDSSVRKAEELLAKLTEKP